MADQPGRLILGIDPGLAATGWALLREPASVVACGTVRTPAGVPDGQRLLTLKRELETVLAGGEVGEAALEELFMGANRTSAIGVAQARGVVLLTLAEHQVSTAQYKPSQIKQLATGYGMAGKAQVARMLAQQVSGIGPGSSDHAVDAIAIALCHSRSRRLQRAVAAAR